jgi:hypothetical protein
MARWSGKNVALCLASASVLVGCFLGGQTGDPGASGDECEPQRVSANQEVDGVSPSAFAQAFAGSYTSTLSWMAGSSASASAPVSDDEITITLTYKGADGTTCGDLEVPVAIEVTTKESGINEMGSAMLSGQVGSIASANFEFSGKQVAVSGRLIRSNGTVTVSGTLASLVADLPGSSAQFPAPGASSGTGSGGSF